MSIKKRRSLKAIYHKLVARAGIGETRPRLAVLNSEPRRSLPKSVPANIGVVISDLAPEGVPIPDPSPSPSPPPPKQCDKFRLTSVTQSTADRTADP